MITGFPGGSDGKESTCNAGDLGSISGSGRSPGEGNGYLLQYSHMENPMDREGRDFACSLDKESACDAGYPDSIPGQRRSPGEGNGYLL